MPSNTASRVFSHSYVLQSLKDGGYYIGSTQSLERRFREHQGGKNIATRSRGPFRLIYYEACLDWRDARQRERYLKTSIGHRYLAKRLRHFRSRL